MDVDWRGWVICPLRGAAAQAGVGYGEMVGGAIGRGEGLER
ncbi:MAG TPA: hypothetical protein VMY87_02390 [Armatimonadota bacterium]|nr:hypothetical protein [Armatimonadota bacterium]